MNKEDKLLLLNYCREYYLSIPKVHNYATELLNKGFKMTDVLRTIDKSAFITHKFVTKTQIMLLDTLHKYEFDGEFKYRLMIEEVVVHCLLEFPVTCEEMEETILAIANYCRDNDQLTYEYFYSYLLKSKTLKKCTPPIITIEKEVNRVVKEYSTLFC